MEQKMMNEDEPLMNMLPVTTEEKLIWERNQNILLSKENKKLVEGLNKLSKAFTDYKKKIENNNVHQMLEKMNKVKTLHENLELEYKRIINANNEYFNIALNKNLEIEVLKTEIKKLNERSFLSTFIKNFKK
jgi:hypothetical protein